MPRAKPSRAPRLRNPFASPEIRAALAVIGRKGGRARWASVSPEERRELARKAAKARWGKVKRRRAKRRQQRS